MGRKLKHFPAVSAKTTDVGALALCSEVVTWEPSIPVWAVRPILSQLLKQLGRKHYEITGAVIADKLRRFAELYLSLTSQLVRKKRFDLILNDESRSQIFMGLVTRSIKITGQVIRKEATHSDLTLQMQANHVAGFVSSFFKTKPVGNLVHYLTKDLPHLLHNLEALHEC